MYNDVLDYYEQNFSLEKSSKGNFSDTSGRPVLGGSDPNQIAYRLLGEGGTPGVRSSQIRASQAQPTWSIIKIRFEDFSSEKFYSK